MTRAELRELRELANRTDKWGKKGTPDLLWTDLECCRSDMVGRMPAVYMTAVSPPVVKELIAIIEQQHEALKGMPGVAFCPCDPCAKVRAALELITEDEPAA